MLTTFKVRTFGRLSPSNLYHYTVDGDVPWLESGPGHCENEFRRMAQYPAYYSRVESEGDDGRKFHFGPNVRLSIMSPSSSTDPDIFFSAVKYKLPDRLRVHPAQAITLRASTNIRGCHISQIV